MAHQEPRLEDIPASSLRFLGKDVQRIDDVALVTGSVEFIDNISLAMSRTPYFCSGCPHNSSVAGVPAGTTVGAGTGCHVLAVFMRPDEVGDILGITAMGNEGAQWIGMAHTRRRWRCLHWL